MSDKTLPSLLVCTFDDRYHSERMMLGIYINSCTYEESFAIIPRAAKIVTELQSPWASHVFYAVLANTILKSLHILSSARFMLVQIPHCWRAARTSTWYYS
eukprot:644759-Pleurochrysis_carterae.AAC.4